MRRSSLAGIPRACGLSYYRSSRLLFLVNCSLSVLHRGLCVPLLQYWVSPEYAEQGSAALVVFVIAQALSAASLAVGFLSWSAAKAGVNLTFSLATAPSA